jgi:Family of unknown function (DUF6152)
MKFGLAMVAGAVVFLGGALPSRAHHSFAAEYDADKKITITGKVTRVELVNPHAWIYVEGAGPDGKVQEWACEFGSPNGLYRNGWNKTSVRTGDTVSIGGSLAKNGSPTINANSITTADGHRLFTGSSQGKTTGQDNPTEK